MQLVDTGINVILDDAHSIFDTKEFIQPVAKIRKVNSSCQTTSSHNYPSYPDKLALVSEFSFSNAVQTSTPIPCELTILFC